MSTFVKTAVLSTFIVSALALSGCQDNTAENIGEDIDSALHDAGNQIEDTCEKTKEHLNAADSDC